MFTGFIKHANNSLFARGFKAGAMESVGFQVQKIGAGSMRGYANQGFLGRMAPGGLKGNWMGNAVFGVGLTAYAAYSGYKEGGTMGAVKGTASSVVTSGIARGLWNMAAGSVGAAPMVAGLAVTGAGYGYYRLGEEGQKTMKRYRNLEMGADINDTFGTMSTMRQRSLSAIMNSHVNGRMALGGEASLMHTPFMR
jgi:hypothetical protein